MKRFVSSFIFALVVAVPTTFVAAYNKGIINDSTNMNSKRSKSGNPKPTSKLLSEPELMDDVEFKVGSNAGQILMANAIRLDSKDSNKLDFMKDEEIAALIKNQQSVRTDQSSRFLEDAFQAYISEHSILFNKCYNTTGYTPNGGWGTYSFVHFTLCPTAYCYSNGCKSDNYAEYMVSTNTFIDAYLESKLETIQARCENMREVCGCNGDEDDCLYYCYLTYDDDEWIWSSCNDRAAEEAQFGECTELVFEDDDDGRRQLGDDDQNYFVGPVCDKTGKKIFLAVYMDEECLYPAQSGMYEYLSGGETMPYSAKSKQSLIKQECLSCMEPANNVNQNDDDADDEDKVTKFCEEVFELSFAQCDENLALAFDDDNYQRQYENGYCGCDCMEEILSSKTSSSSSSSSVSYQLSGGKSSSGTMATGTTTASAVIVGCLLAVLLVVGGTYYYKKMINHGNKSEDDHMNFELQRER